MNLANRTKGGTMGGAEAVGASIGLLVWAVIWFIPFTGMGIVALVTRPKAARQSAPIDNPMATLCPHCGKYYAGQASFCPFCGKCQGLETPASTALTPPG